MHCPTCKKDNTLRPWEGLTPVMGVEIEGRGQRCRSCGEVLIELTERGRQERLAAKRLVTRGIRAGVEFKFVRKLAGLRANEVADMFGVRKETVSRWETARRYAMLNCSFCWSGTSASTRHEHSSRGARRRTKLAGKRDRGRPGRERLPRPTVLPDREENSWRGLHRGASFPIGKKCLEHRKTPAAEPR